LLSIIFKFLLIAVIIDLTFRTFFCSIHNISLLFPGISSLDNANQLDERRIALPLQAMPEFPLIFHRRPKQYPILMRRLKYIQNLIQIYFKFIPLINIGTQFGGMLSAKFIEPKISDFAPFCIASSKLNSGRGKRPSHEFGPSKRIWPMHNSAKKFQLNYIKLNTRFFMVLIVIYFFYYSSDLN
jgi:hypothetical protein